MAAQKGSALLLKRGNGATPTEAFTTAAGLRTKSMTLGRETVDITNADSTDRWRELLAGGGTRTCNLSGEGVFKDTSVEESVRGDFFANAIGNWQIVVPDFGTFEGAFQLTQIAYAGVHNAEVTYTIALESSGVVAFTAA